MIDPDREIVKRSIKHVLEQWMVHRRIARDSGVPVKCANCRRIGLMNIVYIEDGDPVKVTYECRCCHAQIEHECMLGTGRIFAEKQCHQHSDGYGELQDRQSPLWQDLNRFEFPNVEAYLDPRVVYALGCRVLTESGSSRHGRRVGTVLRRLGQELLPPVYWVPRHFLRTLRATTIWPGQPVARITSQWGAGLFLLPENELFSPHDGHCSLVAYAWEKAGRDQHFEGEDVLNLVDKLFIWAACFKTGAVFSLELNLGGQLSAVQLDFANRFDSDEDAGFCKDLVKITLKLSMLMERHPELLVRGYQSERSCLVEPNWLGREYHHGPHQPELGAGAMFPDPKTGAASAARTA